MIHTNKGKTIKVRAFPVSDVDAQNAITVNSDGCGQARASPRSDETDKNKSSLKTSRSIKSTRLRLGTWNLGSMTGRSTELSNILNDRDINICCIQETKWKGSKSRDIGHGYQLIYHGVDSKRNGVAIALDKDLKQRIVSIERKNDRLIAVKLAMDNQPVLNIISAYAPQTGCGSEEKENFWEDFDEVLLEIPPGELVHIGGDLNGHVGDKSKTFSDVHGGYGYGTENQSGLNVLNFASKHNFKIINTCFKKKPEHLITYKSGNSSTQIDYIIASRAMSHRYKDCKVIPGEALTSQHRLLVAVMDLPKPIKVHVSRTERIKWKELHNNKGHKFVDEIKTYLSLDMAKDKPAHQMWADFETFCQESARRILGVAKGNLTTTKDTTWWNSDIKELVKSKREAFKLWQKSGLDEDRTDYKSLKGVTKSAVAQARAASRQNFYDRLEAAPDEHTIFKIAKHRHRSTLDIKCNKYIKDDQGKLLTDNVAINSRWKQYYELLMNEENESEPLPELSICEGPIDRIAPAEVKQALKHMRYHKSLGPDEVPADIWKILGEDALPWLTDLLNKVQTHGKIPPSWRKSYLCPIYKNKGDVANCNNYRGIKLTSHTLKLWERILGARLTAMTRTTKNQFGFTQGRSTTEAIHTLRLLLEKYRINKENLYMVFIDLEKAFDRVPRKLVWQSLRAQKVPEVYINLVRDMYDDVSTQVRSPAGMSDPFLVKVGVHQGSALSPLLFNLAMDHITLHIQKEAPWSMLYADDIVLVEKKASDLQNAFDLWLSEIERHGLRISRTKTEYMECDFGGAEEVGCDLKVRDTNLPKVSRFKYLGSMLTTDARIDEDVTHRVNAAWMKWRSLSGVLCDSKMPIKTKGKVYKTAVRPTMLYGAECWAALKKHEQQLHTAEMKMLRWAGGVTRLDKVRNEYVRGSFKVAPIADKIRESRLRWYGHIMRREDSYSVKTMLKINTKQRTRGRPPASWWTTVERDLRENNLPPSTTQDRPSWRRRTRRPDPK